MTPGWAWSELVPSLPFWQANKNKLLEVIKIYADGVPPHIHTLTLTDTYPPSQAHMVISVTYRRRRGGGVGAKSRLPSLGPGQGRLILDR